MVNKGLKLMMVTSIESSKKELDPILNLPTQHLSSQDLLSSNEQEGDLIYKRQNNIINTVAFVFSRFSFMVEWVSN